MFLYRKYKEPAPINFSIFEQKIDSIKIALKSQTPTIKLVKFDPNTVDSNTLVRLGFSQRQVQILQRYRKAGGHFYRKEDFAKLYFVDDSLYAKYEPYIEITNSKKKNYAKRELPKRAKKEEKRISKEMFLFEFNPNTLSENGWDSLGVPAKTITIIQNYRNKGGKFYKKQDLLKIYGFPENIYEILAPYIIIPKEKVIVTKPIIYNLNTITAEELERLKISESTASKLLGYRKKVGGFVHIKQLLEIHNLKEWDYNLLKKHCTVAGVVRKININTATIKELYSHPYITSSMARDIVRYRKRKGSYTDLETLKEKKIIPQEVFDKLKPYLINVGE